MALSDEPCIKFNNCISFVRNSDFNETENRNAINEKISTENVVVKHPTWSRTQLLGDLPIELILNISRHLNLDFDFRSSQRKVRSRDTHLLKSLRLVNKTFSEIFIPDLFRSIKIDNESKAKDFVNWSRSFAPNYRPRVLRLSVGKVRSDDDEDPDCVSYGVFEQIISLAAPHLVQLQVEFVDGLHFSPMVLNDLARCRHLSTLHLKIAVQPFKTSSNQSQPAIETSQVPCSSRELYSPQVILKVLNSLPYLTTLDLYNCLDKCSILSSIDTHHNLPQISSLSVEIQQGPNAFANNQHITFQTLATLMNSKLKELEIRGSRYDPSKLIPTLSALSSKLESIHLSETEIVTHCSQLEFPQLETIFLHDSRFPDLDQFSSPLFQTVSTLIIRTWNEGLDTNDAPPQIPVSQLHNLKSVILTHTDKPTKATVQLYRACLDNDVNLFLAGRY